MLVWLKGGVQFLCYFGVVGHTIMWFFFTLKGGVMGTKKYPHTQQEVIRTSPAEKIAPLLLSQGLRVCDCFFKTTKMDG